MFRRLAYTLGVDFKTADRRPAIDDQLVAVDYKRHHPLGGSMPLRRGGRGVNRRPSLEERGVLALTTISLILARLPAVRKEPTGFGKDSNAFVQKT
jgi:hypothetical protein